MTAKIKIIKTILEKDKDDIVAYNSLGLAWKSLADWSQKEGVENYKDYYKEALEIYEAGIDKTFRKNTLFMTNAGNMAKYLEDYKLAESYYEEAISVSPGDESYYVLLAELYEYNMNKSEEEIIAVYEAGKKRVLNPLFLEQRKRSFINRFNN